jgi:hypothetical protein
MQPGGGAVESRMGFQLFLNGCAKTPDDVQDRRAGFLC